MFAYRVHDAIGQLGEILTYERDDIMLETQREGRKVSCSCWRHVERWEPGCGTTKMGEHDVVVYCSSTRSSGRSDAISSGALTIACELRCALIAVDSRRCFSAAVAALLSCSASRLDSAACFSASSLAAIFSAMARPLAHHQRESAVRLYGCTAVRLTNTNECEKR